MNAGTGGAGDHNPLVIDRHAGLCGRQFVEIDTNQVAEHLCADIELTLDGDLVYSKLKEGDFPDEQAMVDEVGKRLS